MSNKYIYWKWANGGLCKRSHRDRNKKDNIIIQEQFSPIQEKFNEREVNTRELNSERMSQRDLVIQTSINPFMATNDYIPPLYFYVQDSLSDFDLQLVNHYFPDYYAIANIYDATGALVSTMDTRDNIIKNITTTPGQAGIWKMEVLPGDTMDLWDLWVKFDDRLSGYASFHSGKILKVDNIE